MPSVSSPLESHKQPEKFRVNYEDACNVLHPKKGKFFEDESIPVKETSSKVAIVGAGLAGIATAMSLLKNHGETDFTMFEKHDNFGGTWYANTYPGCCCDIPAIWYSYSDELNTTWSGVQPPQHEMEEYILAVTKKHELAKYARFETAINDLEWNESKKEWTLKGVEIKTGRRLKHTCKIVVSARGGLVYPQFPDIPGLQDFSGKLMHSALWDHSTPIKGKKVVVIGNGCSAAQLVPALLKDYEPESIVQLFRSKHWILPEIPKFVQNFYVKVRGFLPAITGIRYVMAAAAELRYPIFKGKWWLPRTIHWFHQRSSRLYMEKTSPEKYHDLLIPDYKYGCKRLIFDQGYLKSLHDDRLLLSNVKIDRVEGKYVILENGDRIEADIIAACTGYDLDQSMFVGNIVGEKGKTLKDLWREERPAAYETSMVKGFPNLFIVGGPNSAAGHTSVLLSIENMVQMFDRTFSPVLKEKYSTIQVSPEAHDRWRDEDLKHLDTAIYGTSEGGCTSWYSKTGINSTVYPYSHFTMWYRTRFPNYSDFEYM
ncbi:uncharacterized protein KQ657_002790 [Scheffersomyces spartinae]|uniref:Uncharacterized protein n=1 Tax=Scheffersomyces spartinae TaxID=45513 RepID=A0A9P7V6I5_9ASCO|nr:uncharacterized protein KQ657_002790 [Scheffersomyces spartinae]KAG7191824.1 hypothetical protein KQ657_002790 [Scheffersomyces spartinae]